MAGSAGKSWWHHCRYAICHKRCGKQRSLESNALESLPDCFVTQRKSPHITITQQTYPDGDIHLHEARMEYFLWLLLRMKCCASQQIPGWAGFISMTGTTPQNLTTIDYYPVIPHPITDYRTVQECLKYAENVTAEIGQQYVITTFDLGVCMKAYPLIWNNPVRYEKHIVLIGTFHLICAYMKTVGNKNDWIRIVRHSSGSRVDWIGLCWGCYVWKALW